MQYFNSGSYSNSKTTKTNNSNEQFQFLSTSEGAKIANRLAANNNNKNSWNSNQKSKLIIRTRRNNEEWERLAASSTSKWEGRVYWEYLGVWVNSKNFKTKSKNKMIKNGTAIKFHFFSSDLSLFWKIKVSVLYQFQKLWKISVLISVLNVVLGSGSQPWRRDEDWKQKRLIFFYLRTLILNISSSIMK